MRTLLAGVTLVVVIALVACAPANRQVKSSVMPPSETMPSIVATTAPPPLTFAEYRLAGSCSVRAYTSKRALVTRDDALRSTRELLLLDLATGRTRSLLSTPVASRQGLVFGGCTLSDEVVAWEEMSPRDADFPEQTVWHLYACGYDPSKGLVGSPALIDASDGGTARSRPLFAVDATSVVWLSNARQQSGRYAGRVERIDALTGCRATVFEARDPFDTLSLTEHRVLLTREATEGVEELLSLSPGGSPTVRRLSDTRLSHFPLEHAGTLVWSVFRDDKPWPDLFIADAQGRRLLARDALDPVFAGEYLFYESNEASDSPRDRSHYGSIWGIRPGTDRKFRLLLTDVSTEGWWQTAMAQGYVKDVFVVDNDLCPWNEGKDQFTLVRVYRLPS